MSLEPNNLRVDKRLVFRQVGENVGVQIKQENVFRPPAEKGDTGGTGSAGTNGTNGIDGADGTDGTDGLSIVSADFSTGQLILTLSDASTINAGAPAGGFSGSGAFTNFTFVNGFCTAAS